MKTSLGIWALGGMVTRFVPGGYQPEHGAESTAEKVRRAVAGLEGLVDDYEFHYPGELSEDNLDEVREALDGHGIYCIASRPARRLALRQGRADVRRRGRARDGPGAHARGRELRRRAGRALHHLARDRGLQLPVPGALPRELARLIEGVAEAAEICAGHGVKVFLEHKNSEPAMKIHMGNIGMACTSSISCGPRASTMFRSTWTGST